MTSSIEVSGADGESIVYDGATVTKFKHQGKLETARNPASTYREIRIKERTSLFGKPRDPREFEVLLAMSSIMSLTVDEAGRSEIERLAAVLDEQRSGG
ncbi:MULTISPECIES: hypothetical protein [unclassified Microbacterium]|uniref:hypothetical protein n=1 Tax=unclassified Microbacterium TaxID=2609290 RepID=UPI001E5765A5|nr:hypothetical protein [Microbacterium sp. Au-Mic1]MCE4027554.1 hypothetical protein [Microbacterium sp. Au-Mic1]